MWIHAQCSDSDSLLTGMLQLSRVVWLCGQQVIKFIMMAMIWHGINLIHHRQLIIMFQLPDLSFRGNYLHDSQAVQVYVHTGRRWWVLNSINYDAIAEAVSYTYKLIAVVDGVWIEIFNLEFAFRWKTEWYYYWYYLGLVFSCRRCCNLHLHRQFYVFKSIIKSLQSVG